MDLASRQWICRVSCLLLLWGAAGLGLLRPGPARAQSDAASLEYKIKAAYLFNFLKYVEGPQTTSTNTPYLIDQFSHQQLWLFEEFHHESEQQGTLFLAYDLKEGYQRTGQYLGILGGIGVVMLLLSLSLFLSVFLQRIIAAPPLLGLTRAVKLVTEQKDYSVRVSRLGRDEIGQLTDLFNQMLSALAQRDAELEARTRELQDELGGRRRLAAILEVTPDFVGVSDKEGQVLFLNQAGRRMRGLLAGNNLSGENLFECYPSWACQVLRSDAIPTATREGTWQGEMAILNRMGSETPISMILIAHNSGEGTVEYFSTISRDITERKRIEQTLQASREQLRRYAAELEQRVAERTATLQESIKFLEGFCYTIAHDLRAPLRAMEGLSSALLEDYRPVLDEVGVDYAQRIGAAARRMDALIGDLLAFGRLNQVELVLTRLDLHASLERACSLLQEEVRHKQAEVILRPTFPQAWAHATVLEQILTNLLSNALKFSRPQVPARVEIWAVEQPQCVQLFIQDNGFGIAPEYQERIFRAFERLHQASAYPGTGIGLAIVRKGIERMGGQAGLSSEVGVGTTFWIELLKPPLDASL